MPICFRLLLQLMRAAASRTFCTAGSSNPIKIAMIAITTRSSISVNADRVRGVDMDSSEKNEMRKRRMKYSARARVISRKL